jgi:hypothetical protein
MVSICQFLISHKTLKAILTKLQILARHERHQMMMILVKN